jgi:hypothetical protein
VAKVELGGMCEVESECADNVMDSVTEEWEAVLEQLVVVDEEIDWKLA